MRFLIFLFLIGAVVNLNAEGIKLIANSEGMRLKAYPDSSGIWTIGRGHTGPDVKEGMVITSNVGEALFKKDIEKRIPAVKKYLKVELNDNQFSALLSFYYNAGYSPTLFSLINAKRFNEACAFWKTHYITDPKGRKLSGLITRRANEVKLFNKPI